MGRFVTENVTRTQVSVEPLLNRLPEQFCESSSSISFAREQINVIKKRAAKKIVSPSARCLTDGDKLYENEFIELPKKRRTNRKTVNLAFKLR